MIVDDNGVSCVIDDNGVSCTVDDNGVTLCCGATTGTDTVKVFSHGNSMVMKKGRR
jgi:hypothetical protein